MFAVIKTGGKQYKVAENDTIVVESLPGEPGETIALDTVLMIGEAGKAPTLGAVVGKAAVFAEVVGQTRGDKILVFKKKRRQGYRRTKGHRQTLTVLRITGISPTGAKPAAKAKAVPKPAPKPKAEPKPEPEAAAKPKAKPKAEAKPKAKTPAKGKPAAKKEAKPAAKKDTKASAKGGKAKAPAKGKKE